MPLYSFGSNSAGQLSLAHKEDVSTPAECIFEDPPPSDDDDIVDIVAGGNHTLLLTEKGFVYAAGCNIDGRCGPRLSKRVDSIQRKDQEVVGVIQDGKDSDDEILRFRRVILPDLQTGLAVERFRCVSATWEGSILVAAVPRYSSPGNQGDGGDYEDRVFVLGSSPKGELGLGDGGTSSSPVPLGTTIPSFPPPDSGITITALASGMGHSVAILSNGDVYGWGGARKGQLGDRLKGERIVWRPVRIEGIPFFARGAVCGREFTVVFGERERGEFVILGDRGNRWGVLDVPEVLLGWRPFVDVGASWHGVYVHVHAAARVDGEAQGAGRPSGHQSDAGPGPGPGNVVAWGRNDRGQLPPPDLPPVTQLAVGSEHVLALLEDGSVAAFGWGEHGNCGPVTDSRGNVSGSYQVVLLPEAVRTGGGKVVGVGAGCATSWLIVK